jgi:pimeloyl-ACP methyl ester carboxylesterase
LQCPVLIAWGEKDPWEPIELGRAYSNFDAVEDFVVLPDAGHCPQVSLSTSSEDGNAARNLCFHIIMFL